MDQIGEQHICNLLLKLLLEDNGPLADDSDDGDKNEEYAREHITDMT